MNECPPLEQYRKLLAEQLTGAEAEALEGHAAACPLCQHALEMLGGDGDLTPVAASGPAAPTPFHPQNVGEPFLRRLAERKPDLHPASRPAVADAARAMPADDNRDVPQYLGEYRILREVGRGGMGIVYEAVQESLGRHVALKVFPAHGLLSPTHLERFHREAKAAAQLHHTNIVPVFGVGESAGVHYYAMQFIEGQGLDGVLRELIRLRAPKGPTLPEPPERSADRSIAEGLLSGHWPSNVAASFQLAGAVGGQVRNLPPQPQAPSVSVPSSDTTSNATSAFSGSGPELTGQSYAGYFRSVARMGLQVAEALTHAHKQGILHRDIKPSNLLLDAWGTVWVTDFGLAKSEGAEDLTSTGEIVGTLRYMAPERFNGWSDPRSDVYGLGITLYELLTLRPAFPEADRPRLIEQVLHDDPPAPRKLDAHIPRDLETIVLKSAAKEPGNRYATAEAVAEDLRRFLADRSIQARRSSAAERTWRWCRRNPAIATLGTTLALILIGSVVALTALYLNSEAQRHRAEGAETDARQGEAQARQAEADAKAVLEFFEKRVLSAARPKGQGNGLGRNATIEAAMEKAEPGIAEAFVERPLVEASVRRALGLTYWYAGDFPRAVEQHERALALRRAHLEPDHPDILNSMNNLGQALYSAGRVAEALPLHEETLKLRLGRQGRNHPETLWTMNQLADSLRALDRTAQALPVFEEAVKVAKSTLGPDHEDTLIYMENLASAYQSLGRLGEAVVLFEETLKLLKSKQQPDHPHRLVCMGDLAHIYNDLGRWTEAAALQREAIRLMKGSMGPDHPSTFIQMHNLAVTYRDAGRPAESLPLMEEAVKLHKAKQGPEHLITLVMSSNLATVYRDVGRLDDALALFEGTLRLQRAKHGSDYVRTLYTMNELGACLLKMKKYQEAEVLLRECLALRERKDAGDWQVFRTKSQLGQAATGLKRFAVAEALLCEAHRELLARKDKIPPRHTRYISEAAEALANLYDAWGKKEQASRWREKLNLSRPPRL